jgi:hypothetical protein
MISWPNFHDGYVDGVLTSGPDTSIFLRTVNAEKFTIILHGVEQLVLNDFRQGNIVFRVDLLEPAQLDDSSIRDLEHLEQGSVPTDLRERWLGRIKKNELKAIGISASYGAVLVATFHSQEIKSGYSAPS